MIIYTKGWTAKDSTPTPLVFNTKDIFYVKQLGFSSRRSIVVLRDGGGNQVEFTVEASAEELAEKMDGNWWELCGDVQL